MKSKSVIYPIVFLFFFLMTQPSRAADGKKTGGDMTPHLIQAVMCESIENLEPKNIAVAFSISSGRISCYTSFDKISGVSYVNHKWYRHDELVTTKRLTIKPPSWATYSSIQLREADKGPWRVEILNADNQVIKVLRFSVVD